MKRTTVVLLGAIAMAAMSSPARSESPVSPWEMAVATEQWLVEGAGARFPDGMADPASDGDFVFVDGSWPLPFRERVGEAVALRISPDTGCYEFADPDGTVFWTVVPVAPLTWNWISPFRSPLRPDARDLYSPFRIAREWLLLSPAEFDSRAESAENAEPLVTRHSSLVTRGAAGPATNLCFTAFSYTETNLFFAAAWPTNETLPEAVLDLYGSTNLLDPRWTFLSSHPATTNPVSFAVAPAALPWYVEPTQHVHDATCAVATNVVLSPLDGVTVYTNVVWSCTTNRTPVPPGFFQLGTHHDTDGDGLFDSFEKLASGTDPASSDTDGDGVPDGLTWAQWRSHPLWAENGDGTNLVVFLYEPVTNGFAALRFGDLCIPLASNAGPWCLCVPTNAVVDCTLVSGADTVAMLWYGPPEAVEWTPANRSAPGPRWTWDVPDDVAVPIWCDRPMSVFGGNVGGGSCRFARPELRIRSEEPGQEGCLDVCVHGSEGIARFSWSVEPSACTGLWAFATGHLSDSGDGRSFCIDVSNAVPGSSGARTGMLFAESIRSPFFGDDVLFGTLSGTVSAHRCEGLPDPAFGYCLSCGVVHDAPASAGACYHEPGCATKTNLFEDCDCAPPFVRIGGTAALRIVGDFLSCCHAHDFYPSHAELLSAPDGLRASLSNGLFLGVAPEARSPTIGGFVADCRIWDWNGAPYRDQAVRFTCADLRVEPCLSDAQVPYEWEEAGPDAYYLQDGTFYVARRADPYPVRLWNESPSDARLVFAFASPTNGPGLFDPSLGTRHSSLVTTNAAPFAALNDDRTVYLDALCSNVLATLSLTLSDPIADRTFLSESLAVKVVDTAVGEHWRVRSATDTISWDFSDAPEDVYAYLWRPNADSIFGDLVGFKLGRTPSLSLDLPPGDYLLDFYFPRVYDGGSWAAWSTNTLHILDNPAIVSLDGHDTQNRAAHHTDLFETNAVVVRRAQSFRFDATVTKWFDPTRHELRFFLADDFDGHWTTNEVLAGTGTQPTTEWFYRIISTSTESNGDVTLVSDVYCSTTNCPVGAYRIGARLYDRQTGGRLDEKGLEQDLIVLFNPWSDKDSVYMADVGWRNECIMAQSGKIWIGTQKMKKPLHWNYEQFAETVSFVALKKLAILPRAERSSPAKISRHFSWCVNSAENVDGILRGRWENNFPGGTAPWDWDGSLSILTKYRESDVPVKYGQCFVFAGVLTTCMRSIGIPSRPVTTYESGHDKGRDGFVDKYRITRRIDDENLSDRIWNYHVWTECWMSRNSSSNEGDWQVVDGTPQEPSDGKFQCGPARRTAVRQGLNEPFDTLFVHGEVSGTIREWKIRKGVWVVSGTKTGQYGYDISTKNSSSTARLDITSQYKEP